MYATSNSTNPINTLKKMETAVILVFMAGPILTVTNTKQVSPKTME